MGILEYSSDQSSVRIRKPRSYVLTFTNGVSLYVTGDTSTTKQMAEMSDHGEMFDRELAEQFAAPNRLIVYPGEELELK